MTELGESAAVENATVVDADSPSSIARSSQRLDDIEFLRAVAVIMVMIAHLPALFGWHGVAMTAFGQVFWLGSGVDLFFVISGFVITRSFLHHLGGEIPNDLLLAALPFWTRRVFRILPAAWFWIAFGLAATVFFNRSGHFGKFLPNYSDALAAVLEVANIHMISCYELKSALCGDGGVPFGIYWTLSLEEQFYWIFPLVMVLIPRRFLVTFLAVAAVVQIVVPKVSLLYWMRSDALLVGVLIGLASRHPLYQMFAPSFLSNRIWKITTFFIMTGLVATVASQTLNFVPIKYGMTAIVGGIWVFIASFGKGYALPSSPLTPVLLWIGTRSFALYLCHFIAFCTTREIWYLFDYQGTETTPISSDLRYGILAAVLLFLYAEGTYRFIERPSRRKGALFADQMKDRILSLRQAKDS